MSETITINKMRNVNWDGVKALVDIDINLGVGTPVITLREFKLMQSDHGLWVASPSYKLDKPYVNKSTGKEITHKNTAFIHNNYKETLVELVSNAYDPSIDEYQDYSPSENNVVDFSDTDIPQ